MPDSMTTTDGNDDAQAMLTAVQARVLGSLMEKQMTTPDYYPLTLNALVAACNQKSSRNPVMNLGLQEVGGIVNALRREGLVTASLHGRADRYEQQISRKLGLSSKERAIVCVMLLRGAQTLNEIRVNTNRMTQFADSEEIQDVLQGLMERDEPLVLRLPRAAGQREERYTHLLCGKPAMDSPAPGPAPKETPASPDIARRLTELEETVAGLQEDIRMLREALHHRDD